MVLANSVFLYRWLVERIDLAPSIIPVWPPVVPSFRRWDWGPECHLRVLSLHLQSYLLRLGMTGPSWHPGPQSHLQNEGPAGGLGYIPWRLDHVRVIPQEVSRGSWPVTSACQGHDPPAARAVSQHPADAAHASRCHRGSCWGDFWAEG